MKSSILRAQLVMAFALGLMVSMVGTANAQDHACSLARSAGKWSFTDNGIVVGVGPRTAVGVLTLDGKGNVLNGMAASSLNGSVSSETFSGTYTVNSDCSASFDVKLYSGGTELFELTAFAAYDDDMRQLRGVFTSATTPGGTVLPTVINIEARKQ